MAGVIARSTVRGPRSAGARASSSDRGQAEFVDEAFGEGFLARVVALLSPSERTALRLRHRDGLADRAIAQRMSVSTASVRALIAHAETTLRAAQRAFIEALIEDPR